MIMTPFENRTDRTVADAAHHAHLLVTESAGLVTSESPEAVMEEIEFRATHLSSLMEEMFEESIKHEWWESEAA